MRVDEVSSCSVSDLISNNKLAAVSSLVLEAGFEWKHGAKYQCTTMPVEDTTCLHDHATMLVSDLSSYLQPSQAQVDV